MTPCMLMGVCFHDGLQFYFAGISLRREDISEAEQTVAGLQGILTDSGKKTREISCLVHSESMVLMDHSAGSTCNSLLGELLVYCFGQQDQLESSTHPN
jgi:hypothetical protein